MGGKILSLSSKVFYVTALGFEPDDYRVPFEEEAHQDPTLEEITRIVCHDKIRPQLAENIGKNFSSFERPTRNFL